MSISSELTNLQTDITNARTQITTMGGQVTASGGSSQLAVDIATIPTGITPTGTINIIQNGTHDVTNYANANVNVPTGGSTGMLEQGINFVDYDGTFIESWTFEELASKTSLPTIPDHSNDTWHGLGASLTNGSWNWTLAQIQDWATRGNNANQNTFLVVGAVYDVPTTMPSLCRSNCFRMFLNVEEDNFTFNICVKVKGTLYIQFDGDATTQFTMVGTSTSTERYSPQKTLSRGYHVIEFGYAQSVTTTWNLASTSSNYFTLLCKQGVTRSVNTANMFGSKVKMIHTAQPDTTGISQTDYAFAYCRTLYTINFKGVTFGQQAFYYGGLKAAVYNTTSISTQVFSYCKGMSIFSPHPNLTSASGYMFMYCKNEWLSLGNIRTLGSSMFGNCTPNKIIIPYSTNDTTISSNSALYNANFLEIIFNRKVNISNAGSVFANNYQLQKIEFKGGVTLSQNINCPSMYSNCYSLSLDYMEIPETINNSNSAGIFQNCQNMSTFTVPAGWTILPNTAFQYSALKDITIHSGITSIGTSCLATCLLMEQIKFEGSTPPTASNANWYSSLPTTCKILVPAGSLSAYTSATNYPPSGTYTYEEY